MASSFNSRDWETLVKEGTNWRCISCSFTSPLPDKKLAEIAHRACSPRCNVSPVSSTLEPDAVGLLGETSMSRSHLESPLLLYQRNSTVGSLEQDDASRHSRQNHEEKRGATTDASDVLHQLRCAVCLVKWCESATIKCRHLTCCDSCLQKIHQKQGTCAICRATVEGCFPVKFHSGNLLNGIYPPRVRKETEKFLLENRKTLKEFGFQDDQIEEAVLKLGSASLEPVSFDKVLDLLLSESDQPHCGILTPEDIEEILKDPEADEFEKARIHKWLMQVNKCLLCGSYPPNICLMPCNHLAICIGCYNHGQPRSRRCPDCNAEIDNHVLIFM